MEILTDEHGSWDANEHKWVLIYTFPRKHMMDTFIKHIKNFGDYDRKFWRIDECHKLAWDRYFKKLSLRYKTLVCYQWIKDWTMSGLNLKIRKRLMNSFYMLRFLKCRQISLMLFSLNKNIKHDASFLIIIYILKNIYFTLFYKPPWRKG